MYNQFMNPYAYPNMQQLMNAAGLTQQPMQQPVQQPANVQQPAQQSFDWIPVPNVKAVENVNVQPGGKAWVMVQNEPIFALRTADQMGLVTTSYYRFEKIDPAALNTAAPAPEYVTHAEFDQFVQSLSTSKKSTAKKETDE